MSSVVNVSTIDGPEFINLVPYNPLISQCEIKVMYLNDNRNYTYFPKDVAIEMANTLPGCPIVGCFDEHKEDFLDHAHQIVIENGQVHFNSLTRPYGFVAPNAKVWFQKFEETNESGETVVREYLMTTGYLWTGQYPECRAIFEEGGRPQSMEIDEDTLEGEWSKDYKKGVNFFIVNDAIFSKLCILGEDVEPCFEGASISALGTETSYSKATENHFAQTLYTMMQDLKSALEGEQEMSLNIEKEQDKTEQVSVLENQTSTEDSVVITSFEASKKEEEEEKDKDKESKSEDATSKEEKDDEKEKVKKDFSKEDEDEKDKKEEKVEDKKEEEKDSEKEEEDEAKKKYALLEAQFTKLQEDYSLLKTEYQNFKNQIEDKQKDAMIDSFYMLSKEDKKEIIENKSKYSLDEIESKLSVICVRKKVNFDLEDSSKEESQKETPATTFSLEESVESVPAWIAALKNTQNSKNI